MSSSTSSQSTLPPACYYYGKYTSKCGYCKEYDEKTNTYIKKETSVQVGMNLFTFTPDDYEKLFFRGWQRSGAFGYLPQNEETCCPQYAIRLDTSKLELNKKQKKVMNKWETFLSGKVKEEKEDMTQLYGEITKDLKECVDIYMKNHKLNLEYRIYISSKKILGVCDFSTSIAINLCKLLKMKDEKSKEIGDFILKEFKNNYENHYKDIIEGTSLSETGHINFILKKKEKKQKENKKRDIELKIDSSSFKEEEFELYKKYQIAVHHDTIETLTVEQYKDFLCESPLQYVLNQEWNESPLKLKYGSFHIQYILDGKLIAVSVIDVLPHGISSKYHFYDPDYSFLSLGIFSVIQECEIVKYHTKLSPLFKYYYLGYYVHNNSKVNYKGNYSPSELLCPITHQWVPIEKCRSLLNEKKYCQFYQDEIPISSSLVIHHGFTCDICRKFNFTGNRYHCLNCPDFDLCSDCYDSNSSLHFKNTHQWKLYDFDLHGGDIVVYYSEKITTLKKFEFKLKNETKKRIEDFKRFVGDELSSKIIYLLKENDVEGSNEEIYENSLKKSTQTTYSAFSGGGRSLKKEEEIKIEENNDSGGEYEYKFDETQPSTSIQFRFHDGTRLVEKFNLNDTIGSLYSFVESKKPVDSSFDLMKSHPRLILNKKNETIKDAGLEGVGIIQIKK